MAGLCPSIPTTRSRTPKAHRAGTHRAIAPEATLERVLRLMPAIGATRVANVTGLDIVGVPVVTVCRPRSRSISVSQGKGLTLAAAKASALMEALELHAAERPEVPLLRASAHDMKQRGRRVVWEGLAAGAPSPGRDHHPILWAEGAEVASGASVWVPFSLVHMDWTRTSPTDDAGFLPSSNGLASGNHPLEALSHGICEVIERDAKTLWRCRSLSGRETTRVDRRSVNDPDCLELMSRMRNAGLTLAIWDLTSDVGVPAFMCKIADDSSSELRAMPPFAGEGCHPSREIALIRALTEAAQSRLTFIVGSRDDIRRAEYEKRLDPRFIAAASASVRAGEGARSFIDVPTHDGDAFEEDVVWELERLRGCGLETAVAVDLTSSELGIPVVRVIVPGLEGASEVPGYVPGPRARTQRAETSA